MHNFPPLGGFQPLSLVDYPGKACAVLFLQGCNLACPFCHNPQLIPMHRSSEDWAPIWTSLLRRKSLIHAVTVTGGEPSIHRNLPHLLRQLKEEGFHIKLDTNGTRPSMLSCLMEQGLVDYIAMDIKSSLDSTSAQSMGSNRYARKILESIRLVSTSGVPHEFRSTLHNEIGPGELLEMTKLVPQKSTWYIQKCREVPGRYSAVPAHPPQGLLHANVQTRGF